MMRILFKGILFCLLLGNLPVTSHGQMEPQERRQLNEERLEEFRDQKRFNYLEEPSKATSNNLGQRFFRWLTNNLNRVGTRDANPAFEFLFFLVIAGILVFAIIVLVGMNGNGLFSSKGTKGFDFEVSEENIHQTDFEKAMAEARDRQDYRRAIRLGYLYSLKLLSDARLIAFQPGKTNYEYQQELQSQPEGPTLGPTFENLSNTFAYAWYGNFPVALEDVDEMQSALRPLRNLTLRQEA